MDISTSRRLVLVSLLALMIMAAYRGKLSAGESIEKRLWGVGVLGLILTLAADVAPKIAGPFAVLVAIGYATGGGDSAIQNVLGKVSGSSDSSPLAVIAQAAGAAAKGTPSGTKVPQPTKPGTNP